MLAKGAGYVYVAGRIRPREEMNGKSGNLNNVLEHLYGDQPIPGNEILCILDADMVLFFPAIFYGLCFQQHLSLSLQGCEEIPFKNKERQIRLYSL